MAFAICMDTCGETVTILHSAALATCAAVLKCSLCSATGLHKLNLNLSVFHILVCVSCMQTCAGRNTSPPLHKHTPFTDLCQHNP